MMGFGNCCSYGAYGWTGMLINILFFILVFGGIIGIVIWAVRRLSRENIAGTPPAANLSPQDWLQLRYARGEISREDYLAMLQDLTTKGNV